MTRTGSKGWIGPTLTRAGDGELMDRPDVEPRDLAQSLQDLREVNRWLGGRRSLFHHLLPLIRRAAACGPVRLLDVATGSGDLPLAVSAWARAEGIPLQVVATDVHPAALEVARVHTAADPGVCVEAADALALPYEDGAFSLAMCSTALHHFAPMGALRALRELDRVASCGMVMGDLRRSIPALFGAYLLARTLWRDSRLTRHDGPLSVRRAYTPEELAMLAHAAGIPDARVHAHVPFRLVLVVDRTGVRRA